MKYRIEAKIELIIEHIIKKPPSEITLEDYMILVSELRDIRFREMQTESEKRASDLFTSVANDYPFSRSTKREK